MATNPNTQPTTSPLGSGAPPNIPGSMGIPDTSAGAQFELEEQAAAAARGESYAALWAGFKLPPSEAGDFWALYAQAEQFAANTGWKYLPTPQMLVQMVQQGFSTANSLQVFQAFAARMHVDTTKMPWAPLGMSATTYAQTQANVGDALYSVTGTTDFNAAGLGAIADTALFQGWDSSKIQDYILQALNPASGSVVSDAVHQAAQKFGYLKYGYNYSTFQNYKAQNQAQLRSRYGHDFTDQQAIQNLGDPLSQIHAQGGAFGQQQPFVAAQSIQPSGNQSQVR